MKRPDLRLAVEINRRVRGDDEWFEDPDELDRVESSLRSIAAIDAPLEAAGILAYRLTRAQGFAEGNKRTALLLARWILDNNGLDGRKIISADDRHLARLLVDAASGLDVETEVVSYFVDRA